eukprot:TRINITY_DN71276_c0_g1_i1.p1 TRINITY_DN71276_c0_g1~~TRINITY_DN71276_c0_g1_i1.p1  ORF type:complete len:350 (-),score=30.72 TRINITY_DN71276_c0_g1_i1:678-1727(-)
MGNAQGPPIASVSRGRPTKTRRRASFHSAIITAPSPVYPLPVLPAIVFSGVALIVQNAHLLTEALLERHLLTPTSVEQVSLNPLRRSVTARNVTLEDEWRQKLLNVAELSLTLPSWRKLHISAPRLTLFTKIHGFDLAHNNWSQHFDSIAKRRQDWMVPESSTSLLSIGSQAEVNTRMAWDITVGISAISVSIGTSMSDKPLLPPIPLPSLALSSSKVTSFSEVVQIVQGLIGRAVREAGTKSFPREFRESARRMARNLAVNAAEKFIVQAGTRVKKLQERVEFVEDYIRDLPEGEGVRTWLGRANDLLKSVDKLLGDSEQRSSKPTTPPSQKEEAGSYSVDQYRELED